MIQLQKLNVNWALTCWSTLECSRDKLLLVSCESASHDYMIWPRQPRRDPLARALGLATN